MALLVGDLAAFNPATQAKAYSGRTDCPSTIPDRYAAAGTLYWKSASSTYGSLRIDAGLAAGATERVLVTTLPILGSGALAATTVAGGDRWISAAPAFSEAFAGVVGEPARCRRQQPRPLRGGRTATPPGGCAWPAPPR